MKRLAAIVLTTPFIFLILLMTGPNSRPTPAAQSEYDPREYVPNEVLVKFKEDTGDIIQDKWGVHSILSLVQGRVKTYLGRELTTTDWDPADFSHRSFIGDPYLFHIRIPDYIGVEEAITLLKSDPNVEYAVKERRISSTNHSQ